jgi:hypothetical protein
MGAIMVLSALRKAVHQLTVPRKVLVAFPREAYIDPVIGVVTAAGTAAALTQSPSCDHWSPAEKAAVAVVAGTVSAFMWPLLLTFGTVYAAVYLPIKAYEMQYPPRHRR